MKKEILLENKEAKNQERVKKLHGSCRDLLEKFSDIPLKPDGSYIRTLTKKIDKNSNIYLSTDSILGGTFNREKALRGPLFVYICRKNTKENSEHIKLIELNSNGKYKIDDFVFKPGENGRPHREEISFSDSQVLENCGRFIARFRTLP